MINIRRNIRNLLLDVTLGLILPVLIVMVFLSPLIFGHGFVFYGDEEWPIFYYHNSLRSLFYAWYNGSPSSSSTFFFSLLESSVISFFGTYQANHIFVFLLPFLSGPASYFSILWTLRLYGYDGYNARVASMIGSVFYVINWQNPTLITPLYTWAMSYAITPVLLFLVVRIYKEHKKKDILFFALVSALGDAIPMWIISIGIFIIISLVLELLRYDGFHVFLKYLNDTILLIVTSVLASGYFLFEAIAGFLYGAGGQYAVYSSSSSASSVAHSSSVFTLFDVFVFGQSKYYFFGLNPQNWTLLNLAIPLSLILFILIMLLNYNTVIEIQHLKKGKFKSGYDKFKARISMFWNSPLARLFLVFSIVLAISLFLSKGFNPPFGNVYYIALDLSPPGIQGITRDVAPFLMVAALAYSFIFSIFTLISLQELLLIIRKNGKINTKVFTKRTIAIVLVIILLATALFSTAQETSTTLQKTYSYFAPTYLPASINNSIGFIDSLNASGNIMWMPTGGTYPWKENLTLTDFGANLVENSSSPDFIYNYLFNSNGTSLGLILDLSDTQYLVYDSNASFAFNYPVTLNETQILSLLANQSNIKLVYSSGGIYIYKNLANPGILYAGTPNIGDPYASSFNSTYPVSGSNLFLNSANPYVDMYETHMILPEKIINGGVNINNIPHGYVGVVKYSFDKTLYDYNQHIFSIKNHSFSGGKINITFNYNIPHYLSSYYGNVTFGPNFSVSAALYSSGTYAPEYKPLYRDLGPNSQCRVNNTSGTINFVFPDENGSIVLNYYLGSFSDASPSYYVGTITEGKLSLDPIREYNLSSPISDYAPLSNATGTFLLKYSEPNVSVMDGIATSMNYTAYILFPSIMLFNKINTSTVFSNYNINLIPMTARTLPRSTAVVLKDAPKRIALQKNQSLDTYLQTPVNGTYHLKINVNGTLYIRGIGAIERNASMNLRINGVYILRIKALTPATYNISSSLNSKSEGGNLYNIRQISQVRYSASLEWNGTVLVVLPQPYSPMWNLAYQGRDYSPISLYGGSATGFVLYAPNGLISIYFKMQTPLEIGYLVSGGFAISAIALIVIYRRC